MRQPFVVGHATHPDWRGALALAAAQVDAQRAQAGRAGHPPSLGLVYFSDHYAAQAEALLDELRQRWPGTAWAGSVGVGVAAQGVEYFDEPALALMLADWPADSFEVFSGARMLQPERASSALVHADPATPDLGELMAELGERTQTGYLFGGLAASRGRAVHVADGVWQGGLSGVGFGPEVPLISRVTQGCQPLGPTRQVTAAERHIVLTLDGRPALDVLLEDLGLAEGADLREALPRLRATLVGLTDPQDKALARPGQFGADTRVRHLIGLDPARRAVAVAEVVEPGTRLAFCARDVQAARRDLVRICAEIRDEVESPSDGEGPRQILGAVYVSCAGRGGPHFGGPSAELKIVQHALSGGAEGVPLVGFFAGGEIARHHVYGYTGVLTVFTGAR